MSEIPKLGAEDTQYDGSRMFIWLADMSGLSVDLINFLVCQILALFFASFFRSYLHPTKVSTNIRHAFGLSLGLYFGWFCFGQQAIHIAGLPAVCYITIRTQNPQIVQRLVMIVSLMYLSLVHLHRIYFDYGSYSLDITGPLMIITQKVTLLTFSIHDGFARDEAELTKSQKSYAVRKLPSALEFFSYVLNFQGLMCGPMVVYKDYIEFIDGTNILKHSSANGIMDQNGKPIVVEPSPMKAVVKKVIGSIICAYIFMNWVKVYPIKTLSEDGFLESTSFAYKIWFIMMSTTVVRFKYYHAWLLADAISNISGLGFNGYESDGNPKWDLISNINVISFELATNLRDAINNWNMGTNKWLRMIVYERVPKKYGTLLTFSLSALWHGFYPGYYVTFISGALIVTAARTARKLFRHRFQHSEYSRFFYDILTVMTTRVFMGYLTFPFVLLEFNASLRLYLTLFVCLHLVGLITIYILPQFIRGELKSQQPISSSKQTAETNGTIGTPTKCENNNLQTMVDKITTETLHQNGDDAKKWAHNNGPIIIAGTDDDKNNCDIKINDKFVDITGNGPSTDTSSSDVAGKPNKQLLHSLSETNNNNKCDDNNHLSQKIRERIDSETRNIEDFIDKTVTGIVELKEDLMRVNGDELYAANADGMRKRVNNSSGNGFGGGGGGNGCCDVDDVNDVETFLRKELNMAVNQVNVLPAVLSNSHGD